MQWINKVVLETSDLRRRAETVEFFIHTATVRSLHMTREMYVDLADQKGVFIPGQLFLSSSHCWHSSWVSSQLLNFDMEVHIRPSSRDSARDGENI